MASGESRVDAKDAEYAGFRMSHLVSWLSRLTIFFACKSSSWILVMKVSLGSEELQLSEGWPEFQAPFGSSSHWHLHKGRLNFSISPLIVHMIIVWLVSVVTTVALLVRSSRLLFMRPNLGPFSIKPVKPSRRCASEYSYSDFLRNLVLSTHRRDSLPVTQTTKSVMPREFRALAFMCSDCLASITKA